MGSKVSSALEVGLLMALMCARASENVTFLRYGNSKVVTKSVDKTGGEKSSSSLLEQVKSMSNEISRGDLRQKSNLKPVLEHQLMDAIRMETMYDTLVLIHGDIEREEQNQLQVHNFTRHRYLPIHQNHRMWNQWTTEPIRKYRNFGVSVISVRFVLVR